MRLIDADALMEDLRIVKPITETEAVAFRFAYLKLKDAPIVDAVEVVRCKDCKYMTEDRYTDGNVPYCICSEWDKGTDYDGFCHLGERKEAEDAETHKR